MNLYHGTSTNRLEIILKGNCLKTPTEHGGVSLSTRLYPACYWANVTALADRGSPCILELDARILLESGYLLESKCDPCWGEGKTDWQCEVLALSDVEPLYDALSSYYRINWKGERIPSPFEQGASA